MKETKSNHIQILRGIAIIAVVCIHTVPGGLYQVFLRPFFNFAVALFLFLSGFLSDKKSHNPGKRIIKVIIPYFIWSFIYTVMHTIETPSAIFSAFLKNLVTFDASGPMYYILIYCEFTLIIPLIDKLARSRFKYLGFVISPLIIFTLYTFPTITGHEIAGFIRVIKKSDLCWLIYYFLCWFTYYYLGYLLGNNLVTINKSKKLWFWCWAVSLPIQVFETYMLYINRWSNYGSQIKLSVLLTSTLFLILAYLFISEEKEHKNKTLKFIGDNSFGIYFSHMAVINVLANVPYYLNIAIFPINTIVTIAVDLLLIVIGKKILGKFGKYMAL